MNSDAITTLTDTRRVLLCGEITDDSLQSLLSRYGLALRQISADADIPGSYWQAPEAGLIANHLYIRADTPVHSALHETCHCICMPQQRRNTVHTDAGGDYEEENAVCYLQILLADHIPEMQSSRMLEDMDRWGYSFRLDTARDWFEQDAEDARDWLHLHNIIDTTNTATYKLRID